jgi:hypothetical protein
VTAVDLFTRLSSTHKPDCQMSLEGPPPETVPDPEVMARTLGSDAVGRYALGCRPIYEDLRRVIGQISGLLILARLTSRTEMADLDEMRLCRARWHDAAERLAALEAPPGLGRHKIQLNGALQFSGDAMNAFGDLHIGADNTGQFDRMGLQIKRAYTHLEAASSNKAGLQMVDFTHACCSCAHQH